MKLLIMQKLQKILFSASNVCQCNAFSVIHHNKLHIPGFWTTRKNICIYHLGRKKTWMEFLSLFSDI